MKPGSTFEALRHRDFAVLWAASTISNAGSWMQTVAVPFVVYDITRSLSMLGIASLVALLPGVAGTMTAAAIADRFPSRTLLALTQSAQMVAAMALWLVWITGHHVVAIILVCVGAGGFFGGLNQPVWQSIVAQLVPRESLGSAIRLNSLQFSLARSIGPFLGAWVLHFGGPGVSFGTNAVTFVLVIAGVAASRPVARPVSNGESPLRQLAAGWRYVMDRRSIRIAPLVMFVMSLLAYSWMQLAAALARDQFHQPKAIGYLVGAYGVGSVIGALTINTVAKYLRRSSVVLGAIVLWGAGIAAISFSERVIFGCLGLGAAGLAHVATTATMNTAVHMQVDDDFRGRTMALYTQSFFLGVAIGGYAMAKFAERVGLVTALRATGIAIAGFAVYVHIGLRLPLIDGDEVSAPTPPRNNRVNPAATPEAKSSG